MGRYYSGDIEGKLWFGVQDSDDADFFGCEGEYLYWDDEEGEEEPYAIGYNFGTDDLEEINEGIRLCVEELGEYKEKFDKFFENAQGYNDKMLDEATGCGMDKVKNLLEYYARLDLGLKIKKCVEETGQCCFDCEC